VLGMNPFDVAPEALKDIPLVETIFEGKTVFKAP
jgi:predicted amidohydrolase YtcJ